MLIAAYIGQESEDLRDLGHDVRKIGTASVESPGGLGVRWGMRLEKSRARSIL